jgi:hypothetical protein
MSKASKSSASEHMELEGYEGHFEDFGPYTVGFETYTADAELAPLFVGLPDDHCQCPHFGYVMKGRLKSRLRTAPKNSTKAATPTTRRPDTSRRSTPELRSWSSVPQLSCKRPSRSCRETWRPESAHRSAATHLERRSPRFRTRTPSPGHRRQPTRRVPVQSHRLAGPDLPFGSIVGHDSQPPSHDCSNVARLTRVGAGHRLYALRPLPASTSRVSQG